MSERNPEVTRLLQAVRAGDNNAGDRLVAAVYDELRRMAAHFMRGERGSHTLQTTALVHEAYLRLVGSEPAFESRAYFFGAAAEAMRRVLIDAARRKRSEKRGGDRERVTLADVTSNASDADLDILALDIALDELAANDTRLADVAKLRYFVGLSIEETASALQISPATVKRDWTYARAWLHDRISDPS